MGEILKPQFDRSERTTDERGDSENAAIEARIEEARQRLGEQIGDPEAEDKLLLLNNLGDLRPMTNYLKSLAGRSSSSEVKATAEAMWRQMTSQELIHAVLSSDAAMWQKYPQRYWELIYEYQRRVWEIIGKEPN